MMAVRVKGVGDMALIELAKLMTVAPDAEDVG